MLLFILIYAIAFLISKNSFLFFEEKIYICVFLFICMCDGSGGGGVVAKPVQLLRSLDCSLPGSSVTGILQAGMLEWVAISFSICVRMCIYLHIYSLPHTAG